MLTFGEATLPDVALHVSEQGAKALGTHDQHAWTVVTGQGGMTTDRM